MKRSGRLSLTANSYVKLLVHNDQGLEKRGLARRVDNLPPSKYVVEVIPVSMPARLFESGQERAKTEGLDFSSYVLALALEEIEKGGDFTIRLRE